MSVTRWWAAGLVGVMVSVAGCGGATEGAPLAEPTTTSVVATPVADEPWDPCTIPDSAVEAAGLDVESKSTNLFGDAPLSTDWKTCIWTDPDPGSWYFLGVFSSGHHDLAYLSRTSSSVTSRHPIVLALCSFGELRTMTRSAAVSPTK
ncbi:MAG: hypothetical protein U5N21_07755 [Rhodococcus sp. (in: high G+C Gram-positive bacteria)]|nr:hypothetical protein [Rhodococcus sp. (in: high G+C Gram-positive bacteria)]